MKYCLKSDSHVWACMVLPVNSFGSASLILICGRLLLLANSAHMGIIAGVAVVYIGIEYKPVDVPACCSVIFAFYLLNFGKQLNTEK